MPHATIGTKIYPVRQITQIWRLEAFFNHQVKSGASLLDKKYIFLDGAARVIPFVPLIQAPSSAFLLPGTQTQPVIYPPGYGSSSAAPPNGPSKEKTPRDRS